MKTTCYTIIFLISIFSVKGQNIPTISLDKEIYQPNEAIIVSFSGLKHPTDWFGIDYISVRDSQWYYSNGLKSVPNPSISKGKIKKFKAPSTPGRHVMAFYEYSSTKIKLFVYFDVAGSVEKTLSLDKLIFKPGEKIAVSFTGGASTDDWIGIDVNSRSYDWFYLNGTRTKPVTVIPNGTLNHTAPLLEGFHSLQFYAKGNYLMASNLIFEVSSIKETEVDLKVLGLNIWNTAAKESNYIANIIKATDVDIAIFTEIGSRSSLNNIALKSFGSNNHIGYFEGHGTGIISKYRITKQTRIGEYSALFEVDVLGTKINVVGCHLNYKCYASYLPRGYNSSCDTGGFGRINPAITDISTISRQNLQSGRKDEMEILITALNDNPTIIIGDFNEPSHQDWTEDTKNKFDHNGVVYQWDTSKYLSDNNFIDAYRSTYKDEVLYPGFTFPSKNKYKNSTWTPLADERERIDYVFYRGNSLDLKSVSLVGPKQSYKYNRLTSDDTSFDNFESLENLDNWVSDHKGGKAVFDITNIVNKSNSKINPIISEIEEEEKEVLFFPNPVTEGLLNLKTTEKTKATVRILNFLNKVLFSETIQLESNIISSINIQFLPPGLYVLAIQSEGKTTKQILMK